MDFVQQLAATGAVLTLLGATLWLLRRRGFAAVLPLTRVLPARKAAGRRLEHLERIALGPQQTLHLVRLGDMALLLASTPAGCTLVQTVPGKAPSDLREDGQ